MPEETETTETEFDTETQTEGNYYDKMEGVKSSPETLKFAQKYKSAEEAIIGGQKAESHIGSTFYLPPDTSKLTDEQKGTVLTYIKQFRDVPEKPEGYEFDVPEGMPRNEVLEKAFRQFAHERDMDTKDVKELMGFYHNAIKIANEAQIQKDVTDAAEAKTKFQLICASKGIPYERAEENIKRLRFNAATELGLTYDTGKTDSNGNPIIGSKLDDALDTKDAAGNRLGDQLPILQFLSHIHEKYEAEGELVSASGGGSGGEVKGAALSKEFYAKKTE